MSIETLTTERLALREERIADADFFFDLVHNVEAARFQTWDVADDRQVYAKGFVEALNEQSNPARSTYEFAVEHGDSLVGYCGVRIENSAHRRAEMFYAYVPSVWGQGIATEAARRVVDFAFDDLGMHRIWASIHPENEASKRVLQKIGFSYEGCLREDKFVNGAWRSSHLFARLITDD